MDTIIAYIDAHYTIAVTKYTKIFKYSDDTPFRGWMYPRSVGLRQLDTSHSLLTFDGNSDDTNDTMIELKVCSKTKPSGGSYDDHAVEMFNEVIKQIRALAKTSNISSEAYLQLTTETTERFRYKCVVTATLWLTKRGANHA